MVKAATFGVIHSSYIVLYTKWLLCSLIIFNCVFAVSGGLTLVRYPQNQTVFEGQLVHFHCVPKGPVKFLVWYMQRFSGNQQPEEFDRNISHEATELALCQPNLLCKKKHSIPELTVNASGVLTISHASARHAGKYKCMVVDGVETTEAHAFLSVATQPAIPTIYLVESKQRAGAAKEGDVYGIACKCRAGYPRQKLLWIITYPNKTGSVGVQVLQNEPPKIIITETDTNQYGDIIQSELRMLLTWTHHGAEIGCKAVNSVGASISQRILLQLEFTPRILPFIRNPWIITQVELTDLQCKAVGNPEPKIQWMDNEGNTFSEKIYITSEEIFTAKIKIIRWQATLTCVAENRLGMDQRDLVIEFQGPPKVNTNKLVFARLGQFISIQCEVIANPSAHRVYWFKHASNTETVSVAESFLMHNSNDKFCLNESDVIHSPSNYWFSPVFQLPSVTHQDAGVYYCVAQNQVQTRSGSLKMQCTISSTNLQVYYPPGAPTIEIVNPRIIQLGENVAIKCNLNDKYPGLPSPKFRWMWRPRKCQDLLISRELSSVNDQISSSEDGSILVIKAVQLSDDGVITCLAYNGIGETSSLPVNITVVAPVEITIKPNNVEEVDLNNQSKKSINFRCMAQGRPYVHMRWKHNTQLLFSTEDKLESEDSERLTA